MATRVTPISEARSFGSERQPRSGRITVVLLLPVVILLIVGLGALLSASSVLAIREGQPDNLYYFKRQVAFTGIGLLCMIVGARIPYRWYQKVAVPIFALAVVGLIATLVFGQERNYAKRWIEIGPVTLQLSEFAKFAVVVMLATVLTATQPLALAPSLVHTAPPAPTLARLFAGFGRFSSNPVYIFCHLPHSLGADLDGCRGAPDLLNVDELCRLTCSGLSQHLCIDLFAAKPYDEDSANIGMSNHTSQHTFGVFFFQTQLTATGLVGYGHCSSRIANFTRYRRTAKNGGNDCHMIAYADLSIFASISHEFHFFLLHIYFEIGSQ